MIVELTLKAKVGVRADVADKLAEPGDAVLIQRGTPRWLMLKCPCGCGEELPINLDARAGKAWRIYFGKAGEISIYPSVWRDVGCGSHFIVWRDEIFLFGGTEDERSFFRSQSELDALAERVHAVWPNKGWASYVDIADRLEEVPWDVLDACRHLARRKILVEGRIEGRLLFKRL